MPNAMTANRTLHAVMPVWGLRRVCARAHLFAKKHTAVPAKRPAGITMRNSAQKAVPYALLAIFAQLRAAKRWTKLRTTA